MRREQVAQWADKIIASTPERRGVQLIATQTDRTPEFVKDLAYCLRARAPKLVLVQGSVNDGKPMLTVMLGEEITAQGVNAGADAGRRRRSGVLRHGRRQEPRRAAGGHRQSRGADHGAAALDRTAFGGEPPFGKLPADEFAAAGRLISSGSDFSAAVFRRRCWLRAFGGGSDTVPDRAAAEICRVGNRRCAGQTVRRHGPERNR